MAKATPLPPRITGDEGGGMMGMTVVEGGSLLDGVVGFVFSGVTGGDALFNVDDSSVGFSSGTSCSGPLTGGCTSVAVTSGGGAAGGSITEVVSTPEGVSSFSLLGVISIGDEGVGMPGSTAVDVGVGSVVQTWSLDCGGGVIQDVLEFIDILWPMYVILVMWYS